MFWVQGKDMRDGSVHSMSYVHLTVNMAIKRQGLRKIDKSRREARMAMNERQPRCEV